MEAAEVLEDQLSARGSAEEERRRMPRHYFVTPARTAINKGCAHRTRVGGNECGKPFEDPIHIPPRGT